MLCLFTDMCIYNTYVRQARTRGEPDDEAGRDQPVNARGRTEEEAAKEEDEGVDEERAAPALLVGEDAAWFWVVCGFDD